MASIGIDILELDRIERLLKKERFFEKVFTSREIEYLKTSKLENIAGSFACKEAISKVFEIGIGKLAFHDMEIFRKQSGQPYVVLSPKAEELAEEIGIGEISISISHEKCYLVAVAQAENKKNLNIILPNNLPKLKERPRDGHKGTFGKLGIIGGSKGMAGSVYMSSKAALRSGSGLVYSIVPESISLITQIKSLENIVWSFGDDSGFTKESLEFLLEKTNDLDAISFGPGLGVSDIILELLKKILKKEIPLVLDADGINAAAEDPECLKNKNIVITPHRGELARFLKKDLKEIEENPLQIAIETAKIYNIIVVLKGHETIVTNGKDVYINETGNSGMATAGSGDVLTGMIGSFVAQGYSLYEASILGVYLHGLAGDMAADKLGEDSIIASDIIENISKAIREIRKWN